MSHDEVLMFGRYEYVAYRRERGETLASIGNRLRLSGQSVRGIELRRRSFIRRKSESLAELREFVCQLQTLPARYK